jgi:hypothetical protein
MCQLPSGGGAAARDGGTGCTQEVSLPKYDCGYPQRQSRTVGYCPFHQRMLAHF